MTCDHLMHPMYEPNCPGCNPQGFERLLQQSPSQQKGQSDQERQPTRRTGAQQAHDVGYSDTY